VVAVEQRVQDRLLQMGGLAHVDGADGTARPLGLP
jgi:hypothetical protein